jgi:hypothetical protein
VSLHVTTLHATSCKSRSSSVGIALCYGLDDRGSRVRFTTGAGNYSPHNRVQNGSGAHPASYPVGTRGSFLAVKRPGREAVHSPPSSAEIEECVELYLHSSHTPSRRGAQLKHRDNFTFTVSTPSPPIQRYFRSLKFIIRLHLVP